MAEAVCSLLATRSCTRFATQNGAALEALMKALMATSRHDSPLAQTSIAKAVLALVLRFSGAPPGWRPSPAFLRQLQTEGAASHWKYALMGDAFLLMLARREAEFGVDHFCGQLDSTLPPLRDLAATALTHLIPEEGSVAVRAGAVQLVSSNSYTARLLSHLAGDQSNTKGELRKGELVSLLNLPVALAVGLQRPPWPRTKEWSSSGKGTLFSPTNAAVILKLATAVPALVPALEGAVREAMGGDKASNVTAGQSPPPGLLSPLTSQPSALSCSPPPPVPAEVVGGLLGCSAGGGCWVEAVALEGLQGASVETVPEWAATLRFALTFTGEPRRILELLLQPLPAAPGSGLLTRRYMYCSAALGEVGPEAAHFQSQLLTELEATLAHPARQVPAPALLPTPPCVARSEGRGGEGRGGEGEGRGRGGGE